MSPVAGQHGPRLASPLGEPHVVCHYHNLCRSWFSVYHCPQPDTVNTASDSLHFVTINRLLMVRLNNRNTGKRVYTSAAYGRLLSITYMYVGGGLRVNKVSSTCCFSSDHDLHQEYVQKCLLSACGLCVHSCSAVFCVLQLNSLYCDTVQEKFSQHDHKD